jgi:curli biogenesis system outer membrane secretion channel CsgG
MIIREKTMKKLVIIIAAALLFNSLTRAQKIGVLPFEDASGVGAEFGENVAKFIRSEFLKNKAITPKFIQFKAKEGETAAVDVDQALELGKKNNVDFVVIGTILEAEASSSSTGVGGISVLGQSIGSSLRTVSAKITLQGDLLSVKEGKLIESFRTEGSKTDASVGADVSTEWGSLNTDNNANDNSPNAKAMREAVEKLVNQMSEKLK